MFHVPGMHAGWWACCPHILGTCKSRPRRVAHARDGARPSHASRTRRGRVPRAGDACHVVGTLPPHPGNTLNASRARATHPGRVAHIHAQNASWTRDWDVHRPGRVPHAWDGFCTFPGCGGSVPTTWHASPARGTRPRRVGRVLRAERVLDARLGHALSQACGTRPGRILRVPRMRGQCAHHPARVPGMWNTPPMRRTHTHPLRRVINYFTLLIYVL